MAVNSRMGASFLMGLESGRERRVGASFRKGWESGE